MESLSVPQEDPNFLWPLGVWVSLPVELLHRVNACVWTLAVVRWSPSSALLSIQLVPCQFDTHLAMRNAYVIGHPLAPGVGYQGYCEMGPCSVTGHAPILPWVRSRVWGRVRLGSGLASGEGWVGRWPVTRPKCMEQSWQFHWSLVSFSAETIPVISPCGCHPWFNNNANFPPNSLILKHSWISPHPWVKNLFPSPCIPWHVPLVGLGLPLRQADDEWIRSLSNRQAHVWPKHHPTAPCRHPRECFKNPGFTLSLPSSKRMFSQPFEQNCISKVVPIGSVIIFRLSKLWKVKFHTMWCDVLVWLQGNLTSILEVKGLKSNEIYCNACGLLDQLPDISDLLRRLVAPIKRNSRLSEPSRSTLRSRVRNMLRTWTQNAWKSSSCISLSRNAK